ncbi:hypothetical protein LC040_03085 [Bacillus tianshenii]|nr:hypothetical protein LC040_03085 [Bacillus tianshenii]
MIWRIIGALILLGYGSYRLINEGDEMMIVLIPLFLVFLFRK